MARSAHRLPLLGLALAGILVAGCSILAPQSDPTHYYVLTPVVTGAPAGALGVRVALGPVTLPSYLDRPAIVVRRAPHRLDVREYERWAEPLPNAFTRVLEQNLIALLGPDAVSRVPSGSSRQGPRELLLEIDVLAFEPTGDRDAELAARWMLKDARTRTMVAARETAAKRPAGPSSGTAGAVEALSECIGDLGREIAAAVAQAATRKP